MRSGHTHHPSTVNTTSLKSRHTALWWCSSGCDRDAQSTYSGQQHSSASPPACRGSSCNSGANTPSQDQGNTRPCCPKWLHRVEALNIHIFLKTPPIMCQAWTSHTKDLLHTEYRKVQGSTDGEDMMCCHMIHREKRLRARSDAVSLFPSR